MAIIKPFKGLRPPKEMVEEVACAPYDVVNRNEAKALAEGKPHSFMRVIRSEVELSNETDPYDGQVYERAQQNFEKLIKEKILVLDDEPGFYVYRLTMGEITQTGIVGCSSVDEYDQDLVKKHEKTRVKKENDRTRHICTIGAQSGPVFLTYRETQSIRDLMEAETQNPPLYDFVTEEGPKVRHTFWKAEQIKEIETAFKEVPCTYIADGHHRAASASRARRQCQEENPNHTGKEDYNFFLSVLFPHSDLNILAYNRVVKSRDGLKNEEILSALEKVYQVTANADPVPTSKGHAALYLNGTWYGLAPLSSDQKPKDPVSALEVSILYEKALAPIFGIGDQRQDPNIDFVGGIRGTDYLEKCVNEGTWQAAFSLYPTSIEELMQVADADQIMAPKSTWFEPKLRSGLIIHPIRPNP